MCRAEAHRTISTAVGFCKEFCCEGKYKNRELFSSVHCSVWAGQHGVRTIGHGKRCVCVLVCVLLEYCLGIRCHGGLRCVQAPPLPTCCCVRRVATLRAHCRVLTHPSTCLFCSLLRHIDIQLKHQRVYVPPHHPASRRACAACRPVCPLSEGRTPNTERSHRCAHAHVLSTSTSASNDTHTASTGTACHRCVHAHAPPSSTYPNSDTDIASMHTACHRCAHAHASPSSTSESTDTHNTSKHTDNRHRARAHA